MSDDLCIQNCSLESDGSLQIAYYQPRVDLKAVGILHMHTLIVPMGAEYDDEIDAVHQALRALLLDVLEDVPNLETADG